VARKSGVKPFRRRARSTLIKSSHPQTAPGVSSRKAELIFGGTFDPVHLGHIAMLKSLQQLAPGLPIRLLPCALPALKAQASATFEQRVAMLELATSEFENIVIDPREQSQSGASYSIVTLNQLTHELPQTVLILVVGADNLATLTRWHQWQQLTKVCHLLVFNRGDLSTAEVERGTSSANFELCDEFSRWKSQRSGLCFFEQNLKMPQSSTRIRKSIRNNRELDSMLEPSVIKYIRQHHLYASEMN